jgi:DNA-binding response OmpR family regulator
VSNLVVVVDADETERRTVATALAADGLNLVQVESLVEGLIQAVNTDPELIIIADGPGPIRVDEVLPVYRRVTRAPLLIIGDGGDPGEDVLLDRGADFFLPRPFRPSELAVRARVLIQRGHSPRREPRDFPSGSQQRPSSDSPVNEGAPAAPIQRLRRESNTRNNRLTA